MMFQLLRRLFEREPDLQPGYVWTYRWDRAARRCEWCKRRLPSGMVALVVPSRPDEDLPIPLYVGSCCAGQFSSWKARPCTCPECAGSAAGPVHFDNYRPVTAPPVESSGPPRLPVSR